MSTTHIEQFRAAIEAAGIQAPDHIEDDSQLYRFATNGKAGDKSGYYVLHGDGVPAGMFGCWRTGLHSTWCSKSNTVMTEAERQEHRRRMEAMQAQREADKAQAHDEASHAAKPLAQNEPKAAPTLADFAAWLTTSQQRALDAMNATTGDTFGQHCDHFTALTAAINVLSEFQQVAALQSSAA